MADTFRLGRVAGVLIGVNWTAVVAVALVGVILATGEFPGQHPELSGFAHAVAGAAAATLFAGSLLAHELAQVLAARRRGAGVDRVTIWLLGGLGRMTQGPSDPRDDLRASAVGPLTYMGLAALFWALTAVAPAATPDIAVAVAAWVSAINVLLAILNLAPAAPLDGGRALRALVWEHTGDRERATEIAGRAGQATGFLLVVVGLLAFVFLPGVGGLWVAMIGGFVMTAAGAEGHQARMRGALEGVAVGDVMTPRPLTVPGDLTVQAFLDQHLLRAAPSTYPIVDADDRPTGLVTLARVKKVPPDERDRVRVAEVACPIDRLPVAGPAQAAHELLRGMASSPEGRALVVEGGRLVGVVSPRDIMRHLDPAPVEELVPAAPAPALGTEASRTAVS